MISLYCSGVKEFGVSFHCQILIPIVIDYCLILVLKSMWLIAVAIQGSGSSSGSDSSNSCSELWCQCDSDHDCSPSQGIVFVFEV